VENLNSREGAQRSQRNLTQSRKDMNLKREA
jgi:hypothetical protein